MVGKFVLLGSAVAASLLLASSAQAEGRCPDGYYPTGGGTAGWLRCAPMSPIPQGDNSNSLEFRLKMSTAKVTAL